MIGTTIKRRYKLLGKIGGGGMAVVYKALDTYLDQEVAVKILRQQYTNDNEFIRRFRREAESVTSLSHKNVVSICDVGEEKDIYYIVMEYIEGYTLKEYIQKKGTIPAPEAVEIAGKIAAALEHAHQNDIVHRDIKPHNILIGNNGEVKVTDFGIARAVSQATITHTGSVLGSVHYLSPEQARGGLTDEKTDLYSLGIVLYEMVTGTLPFSGDSPISVALKHLQEDFIYPRQIDSEIPQSIENIILKALVKDPAKRYASATEMLRDLETALNPERINEPKIQIDSDEMTDEEKTMVLPALTEFDYDSDSEEDNTPYYSKQRKTKKRGILKAVSILLVISSFVLAGYLGFEQIKAKFIVPEVEVPKVEGMLKEQAIDELYKFNLKYKESERYDPAVEEGYVIKQDPYQGSIIKANQLITLYISLGKEKIKMPDMVNKQQGQASFSLRQEGFNNDNIEIIPTYDEDAPSGVVFKQEPTAGELVIPDETKVMLFISKGKENFSMPDLIGFTESEAIALIKTNDLELGNTEWDYTFEQPKGMVYRQFPYDPGSEVTAGDKIDLWISLGYPENAKTIYGEVMVLVEEEEKAEVTIIVRDSREKDVMWKKETISSTTVFNQIELVLLPDEEGTITVYKNNKLYLEKKVKYY